MVPAANTPAKATIWNRNFICAVLANLLFVLAHYSVNTLVATYTTYLGTTPVIMGLITGLLLGVSLALKPITGPMITKIDKRKLLILIYALGGFVNLGYALFHNVPMFVGFRVLHGIQYGFAGSLVMTLAADSLPDEKMASGMGMFGIGAAVGTAFGPFIGTSLLAFGTNTFNNKDVGFTLVFLFAAIALTLAMIPSFILHPDAKTKADVASMGAWYKNIISIHAIPVTIVLLFVVTGNAVYGAYVINFANEQGIANISVFFLVMAGVLFVSRPLSGALIDRFGVAKVVIPGLILFALSFFLFGSSKTLGMTLVSAVIAAVGIGATQPALQAMCIQTEMPLKRGVASNTFYVGMDSGLFLGPVLGSLVYEQSNFADMFKWTVVPVVIALICFIIILPSYRKRRRQLQQIELQ